jgi:preprotein translocase subunit SecY
LITEQGIGQGISIIIFGGIVARIPQNIGSCWLIRPERRLRWRHSSSSSY